MGFRPFGLKCVSICYINYLRILFKVFISPTSGIRAHGGVGAKVARLSRFLSQLKWERGVCT